MESIVRRLLLILALSLPSPLLAQYSAVDGFPCLNTSTGAGTTASFTVTGGSSDTLTCGCGIPGSTGGSAYGLGTPKQTLLNFGAYSADFYTNFSSSAMPQRSIDWCAAYGKSTLLSGSGNNAGNLVYFPGGGNKNMAHSDLWTGTTSPTTLPGFTTVVADPNQNAIGTGGRNVIVATYEVEGGGQLPINSAAGTTICVNPGGSGSFITNTEINNASGAGKALQLTVEGETVSITNSVSGPSGSCNQSFYQIYTVSPALASTHNSGLTYWLSDSTGKRFADADICDAVTVMNWIACGPDNSGNGIGNRHNIEVVGGSNGAWVATMLAGIGPADKTAIRTTGLNGACPGGANNEYTCANVDDWQITAVVGLSTLVNQSADVTLGSNNSNAFTNALHFGFATSGDLHTISLWDSGCSSYPCILGTVLANGPTPAGNLSNVSLSALQLSPQLNHPGNVPDTTGSSVTGLPTQNCNAAGWNSCKGVFHTPAISPPLGVAIGNQDTAAITALTQDYASIFGVPSVVASDCPSSTCSHEICEFGTGNGGWQVTSSCTSFALKVLAIPDTTYGTTLAWSTTDVPHGTSGSAYSASVVVTGGTSPYTYSIVGGSLANFVGGGSTSLSLNTTTGAITGTPGAVGYADVTLRACDSETPPVCAIPDREITFSIQPTLDIYGALNGKTIPGCTPGYWQLQRVSGRWLWASPTNCNASFDLSVMDVNPTAWLNALGTTHYPTVNPNFYSNAKQHMKDWVFNSAGVFSLVPMFDGTGGNISFIDLMRAWPYATAGTCGHSVTLKYASSGGTWAFGTAVISAITTAGSYYPGMVDVFDPEWTPCANTAAAAMYAAISGLATNKYMKGTTFDESDEWGWTAGTGSPYVDMGYAALVGQPCGSGGTANAVCGSGNPLWTKYALIAGVSGTNFGFGVGKGYLSSKYSTVGALNTAWGTSYTTFGSTSGAGGCASGWTVAGTGCTGMLDENGVLSAGAKGSSDPFGLGSFCSGCNGATIKADLQAFDYWYAYQQYQPQVAAVQALDTNHTVFFSMNKYGGNGSSPHSCGVGPLANYILGFRDAVVNASTQGVIMGCYDDTSGGFGATINKAMYDATCSSTPSPGGVGANCMPVSPWFSLTSEADSGTHTGTNTFGNYATQALRGAAYGTALTALWNAQGTNGDYFTPGMQWWQFFDDNTQNNNYGMMTNGADPYNGNASIIPAGVDYNSTAQGGEAGNYGVNEGNTFIGQVTQANLGILTNIQGLNLGNGAQVQTSGKVTTSGAVSW